MSILNIGTKCSSCDLVDFLPITCGGCHGAFCASHITTHECTAPGSSSASSSTISGLSSTGSASRAGPSAPPRRATCQYEGCERVSIEGIGGYAELDAGGPSVAREVSVVREVRCPSCAGAFCTIHRQQAQHQCPGPKDYTIREEAALKRKAKAAEVLARTFPQMAGRTIPKPPPGRDVQMLRTAVGERTSVEASPSASAASLPPSKLLSSKLAEAGQEEDVKKEQPKVKSRAEKAWEIQLRKSRSLAVSLEPGRRGEDQGEGRRFFEVDVKLLEVDKEIQAWREGAAWSAKAERVWVRESMPVGKVMDLLTQRYKVARPRPSEPSLQLLALTALPDEARSVLSLDTALSAYTIPEGSLVILALKSR